PRWPLWLAGLLLLLLTAGGIALLIGALEKRDERVMVSRDAALVVEVVHDAAVVEVPLDAPIDAPVIVELLPDAGTKVGSTAHRDAGVKPVRPPRESFVTIEILTRPGEANVYIAPNFRGPSGAKVRELFGTKRHVECKTDTMKGSVDVVFDGSSTAVMCTV